VVIQNSPEDERTVRDLNYQLKNMCRRNRDGSFATQANRARMLDLMANQLLKLGYRHMTASSLKPKHVDALVTLWREQSISTGTIKNRIATLRWWAEKINKQNVMARDNAVYGIEPRKFVAEVSKAQELDEAKLAKISDPYVRMSVRLQAAFGLRREEAIKFQPTYAMRGDCIALKSSWTKGGRARAVPIMNDAQRALLEEAAVLAKGGSLIPAEFKYVKQLRRYEHQTVRAGLRKLHGLRHAYAQRRYLELAGRVCPACGGKSKTELSADELESDNSARLQISRELGHTRESITRTYLGR
jgi:site-specific recombinase XerC